MAGNRAHSIGSMALITGASSGIGAALAEVFARNGHNLVLVARNEARLNELGERLHQAHRSEVHIISMDLAGESAPRRLFDDVADRKIEVDTLVNNAGMNVYGEFASNDLADELQMIGVNLLTLTQLTKLFLPAMIQRRKGRILNVGSNGSFAPSPLNAVYSATKAYVLSFSEAIAEELDGTGVTVTALCPGATRSELRQRAGMADVRLLQRNVLDAETVARLGYQGLMAGRRVVIPGLINQIEIFSIRFLPRRLVARLAMARLQRAS